MVFVSFSARLANCGCVLNSFSGSAPGAPKSGQLPGRTAQKVKATLANIPVGNYEGGGRGKERETAGSGHFSFDAQSSPSTHPVEEPPPERAPESSSAADPSEPRSRDGAATKEVRGALAHLLASVDRGAQKKAACANVLCRPGGRSASLPLLSSLRRPPQNPTCRRHPRTKKAPRPRNSKPGPLRSKRPLTPWTSEFKPWGV